jgi:hypothetical protein
MRQSKATNKKLGYIVVPLFIEQKKGETEAEAFTRAGFDEVAEVLGAMLESDDDLVDTIKEMQEARGRGDKFNPRQLHEKIQVIGPAINLEKLTHSIDVEILERLGVSWDRWFGLLQKFHKLEGHSRVTQSQVVDGFRLGAWVNTQRYSKNKLSPEKIKRLDSLGFSWDPISEQWEDAFKALQIFQKKEGHCKAPRHAIVNDINLGAWVGHQRKLRKSLTIEQVKRLDSLGFSWDPIAEQWEEHFKALEKFRKREGHCRVTHLGKEQGLNLGTWVSNLRKIKNKLNPIQVSRLDQLNFSWDPHDEQWEEGFAALLKFHKQEGHCQVTRGTVVNELNLGSWVLKQRQKKQKLSPNQVKRLEGLGFNWDPITNQWEKGFESLQAFRKKHGHCNVAANLIVNKLALGTWVGSQRAKSKRLSAEQVRRLDSLGFIWDPIAEQWEEHFEALQKFLKREGHCRVSQSHKEDGINLGTWAGTQRTRKSRLAPDRIRRLNSIGFSWDPITEQWEEGFAALQKFRELKGHCCPASSVHVNNINLASWVIHQRQKRGQLTSSQLKRLNSIGFSWDPRREHWEKAYSALKEFKTQAGHCRVAKNHEVNGIRLYNWNASQRARKASLTKEQISRLNSIGFSWDPFEEQWEEGFAALLKFHKKEGHCQVTRGTIINELNLGTWVLKQRQKKQRLSPNQIKRLEGLGFCWDPFAERWEEGYATLIKFKMREGHCLVSQSHIEGKFSLGTWVSKQRQKRVELSADRIKRLETIGFDWKPKKGPKPTMQKRP